MVSVQIGASFAKRLFPEIGAAGATAYRVALAALILAVVLRPWRSPPPRNAWPVLGLYGITLGLMNLLFYSALQRIPLGVAVAIEFVGPLSVAVLSSRRWIDLVWVGLAITGLLILLPLWTPAHALDLVGVLLALGAGMCWGLYIVAGRGAGEAHGAQATAIGMVVAAIVVLPAGAAHASAAMLQPSVLLTALGVALLSSVAPYSLEMYALTRIPTRVFGTLMSLEPAIAALMGLLILHERLTASQCLAIGVIMAASLGATLTIESGRADAAPTSYAVA